MNEFFQEQNKWQQKLMATSKFIIKYTQEELIQINISKIKVKLELVQLQCIKN